MVQKQTIEQVRREVANCADEDLVREFDAFFQKQPEICDFVMDCTYPNDRVVGELSLYLSYVTFKTLAVDTGLNDPVPATAIVQACIESQEWIQRIDEMDAAQFASAPSSETGDEPYLLGFVITEVQDAIDDGLDLDDEDKGKVFFVLKTVISSMTAGAG